MGTAPTSSVLYPYPPGTSLYRTDTDCTSVMPEPGPHPDVVPLSVAVLNDGDGGEMTIPSVWRDDIRTSDAETETVEIATKNQRFVARH